MNSQNQVAAIKGIIDAIVETVKEAGTLGAPCSSIYLALQAHGCTLENYEKITSALVIAGLIRKSGDCFFFVKSSL